MLHRLAPASLSLLLVACPVADHPDALGADGSASVEAGSCGLCPLSRPHCDEGEGLCVECEDPDDCTGGLTACVNGRCVACAVDRDCPELDHPECYIGTHACRPCVGDDACSFRSGTPHCILGACAP